MKTRGSLTISVLDLTQGILADRSKMLYGQQIQPDETYYSSTTVDKAIAWLLQ